MNVLPTREEIMETICGIRDGGDHPLAVSDYALERIADAILARLRPAWERLNTLVTIAFPHSGSEHHLDDLVCPESNTAIGAHYREPECLVHGGHACLKHGHLWRTERDLTARVEMWARDYGQLRDERDALRADLARVKESNQMWFNEAKKAHAEAEALAKERDDIAFRVEHPEQAHLHYDGCPFGPYANKRDDDIPEPRPECACGEAAKGAYWKGQHLLERGYHDMTKQNLVACAKALFVAEPYTSEDNDVNEMVRSALARPGVKEALKA